MKAPRKSRGSLRAKSGLSAKAGRRKVYGPNSKRKTKDWTQVGKGFCMNSMYGAPALPDGLKFRDKWKSGQTVMVQA